MSIFFIGFCDKPWIDSKEGSMDRTVVNERDTYIHFSICWERFAEANNETPPSFASQSKQRVGTQPHDTFLRRI